jgi:hypothetical protein
MAEALLFQLAGSETKFWTADRRNHKHRNHLLYHAT